MSRLAHGLDPIVNSFRLPEQVHTEHTLLVRRGNLPIREGLITVAGYPGRAL